MSKKKITTLCTCLLCIVALFVVAIHYSNASVNTPNSMSSASADNNTPNSMSSTSADGDPQSQNTDTDTLSMIYINADLAVSYNDYDSLSSSAETIVVGTISDVETYYSEIYHVETLLSINVSEVLKGDAEVGETLEIITPGGSINKAEYYYRNEEYLSAKLSPEVYENEVSSIRDTDVIECQFMGVDNPQIGDEVLFYLTYSPEDKCYRFTGSSYSGLFYIDSASGKSYKQIDGNVMLQSDMETVSMIAAAAVDLSSQLRAEAEARQNTSVVKDEEITQRDPYYDQFKTGSDYVSE